MKIEGWIECPSKLDDEDFEAPSIRSLDKSLVLALAMRNNGLPPPSIVSPNGEGGVIFERSEKPFHTIIEIEADTSIEVMIFKNGKLLPDENLEVVQAKTNLSIVVA
ncbi:MAG: hypothetical protein NUW37_04455 [Planctomycetes bacterium]|nr:hypothetical protein [Planctomycetota bacterium]